MIDKHVHAAIIGWYRAGATIEEIMGLLDYKLKYWQVEDALLSICPCVMLAEYDNETELIIVK